jgi:transporter family protein
MVLFGIHYFFVKIISPNINSASIAIAGGLVYFLAMFVYLYFTKTPLMPEQQIYWWYAVIIGIPMAIGVLTIYLAVARGPLSVVMPIYGLNAMVTAVLGIIFLHEPLSVPKVFGLVFAVAAIVLLSR